MGRKGKSKYDGYFKVGDVYNNWTISGPLILIGEAKIGATCTCGYTANVNVLTIIRGHSKGCIKCDQRSRKGKGNHTWKGFGEIPGSFTQRYKRKGEKDSKYKWETTEEELHNMYLEQDRKCALSGMSISFENQYITDRPGFGFSCTASLDRIDSSKGYATANLQLLHKDINIMKNTHSEEDFIALCKLVAKHNEN
jgi:hypothetical protein